MRWRFRGLWRALTSIVNYANTLRYGTPMELSNTITHQMNPSRRFNMTKSLFIINENYQNGYIDSARVIGK
jgi:hypothetical protein